ncbi:response regulator [Flaviaesturariibacter amylovorans]|uniref:Response regulator n=1 Tax=Flaviaesturariibacter amylovorans TaxID=1084520 RepID=A0ABP8H1K4_9BACT
MQKLAFRILLVEDDADDRYIMHQAFTELQFIDEVKMFCSGEELLDYLQQLPEQSHPDLFVLDYNMPAINGAELALSLQQQQRLRHIPIVLYSTGMSPKMQRDLLSKGVLQCYEKGMEYGDILELARLLVRHVREGVPMAHAGNRTPEHNAA